MLNKTRSEVNLESRASLISYFQSKGWDNAFVYYSLIEGAIEVWSYHENELILESYFKYRLVEQKVLKTNTDISQSELQLLDADLVLCLDCQNLFFWYSNGDSTYTKSWPVIGSEIANSTELKSNIAKDLQRIINMYYTITPLEN